MEFEGIDRRSIVIKPSDEEDFFSSGLPGDASQNEKPQSLSGDRIKVTGIDGYDLGRFQAGDLDDLTRYVTQGPEPNKLTVNRPSYFRTIGHTATWVFVPAGTQFYETKPQGD